MAVVKYFGAEEGIQFSIARSDIFGTNWRFEALPLTGFDHFSSSFIFIKVEVVFGD